MASLHKKPDSPFWQLRIKENGKWKKSSTGLRWDDPVQSAQARELRAKFEAAEHRKNSVQVVGWGWVLPYFQNCGLAAKSVIRYEGAWNWVALYLQEHKLDVTGVRYDHVHQYIDWRVGRKKKSGKKAGRNTAIQEVKILQGVMNEAVRRGMIIASPLAALKLRKDPAPKKRMFTDEEVDSMRAALRNGEPEWMKISFDIALFTGCRMGDTLLPMESFDLDAEVLTFPCPKGGVEKSFSIPIPSGLMPLLRELKADGRSHTFESFPFQPSRRWQQFFEKMKIDKACFHCLRVTKVTRLRQQGVPREAAMRLVNHSSELIHMGYDRHQVADLEQWRDSGVAGSAAATSQSPTSKPSRTPRGRKVAAKGHPPTSARSRKRE